MAKIETLEWKPFMSGEVKEKNHIEPKRGMVGKIATVALIVAAGATLAHALPTLAAGIAGGKAIAVMASAAGGPDFSSATRPIKDLIFGAAHEIYFVFMAWGAMEALIGKPAAGFTRMKISTGAYILLYWVPWIVDQVNKVRPIIGY